MWRHLASGSRPSKSRLHPFAFQTDALARVLLGPASPGLRTSRSKRSLLPARFRPVARRAVSMSASRRHIKCLPGLERSPDGCRTLQAEFAAARPTVRPVGGRDEEVQSPPVPLN